MRLLSRIAVTWAVFATPLAPLAIGPDDSSGPGNDEATALLDFFDARVASGDLVGEGRGSSASGRLDALRHRIEAAEAQLQHDRTEGACAQLANARLRTDPPSPPPDFASGPAGCEPAQDATFTVDSTADADDASPGDGLCADAMGRCTLRAAATETNALAGEDVVYVPAGVYETTLHITDDFTIVGAGADQTSIPGIFIVGNAASSIRDLRLTGGIIGLIYDGGTDVEVIRSAIADNAIGILMLSGNLRVVESTLSRNADPTFFLGSGALKLETSGVTATLINSTVSGYESPCDEYGCLAGPAITNDARSLYIANSTVAGYIGDSYFGGAIVSGSGSVTTLAGTVLANGVNCSGQAFTSLGHNIASDASCGLTDSTDLPNTDPLLGRLQNNGGRTQTHALLLGSPASDAVPSADCSYDDDGDPGTPDVPLATDQRGVRRPQGAACDIGAYEVTACADGIDNDGDGGIDFDGGATANNGIPLGSKDRTCASPSREREAASCGLGAGLVSTMPLLAWLRRRRSAQRRCRGSRSSARREPGA